MENAATNPEVDAYFRTATKRQEELDELRTVILDCGLTEELKWRAPCYSVQNRNIVIIQAFKAYSALLFFKGALLSDPDGVLQKTGENAQVGRQIRFANVGDVVRLAPIVKTYIYEAIEVEKAGLRVTFDERIEVPEEFQRKFDETPALKVAFDALTPGRQRAYIFYFSAPKQSKTRESRIEKYIPQILDGKGLDDR
jgi:uncharacterized protein YdeI (YjbR/CyaY-like superfamily)